MQAEQLVTVAAMSRDDRRQRATSGRQPGACMPGPGRSGMSGPAG